jgi:hypothetical protein
VRARARARSREREIVELEEEHVAALAAALEVAPGRRPVLGRRDDLEEVVAQRAYDVVQPEHADARVAKGLAQSERVAQARIGGLEVARDEHRLAEANAG